MIKFMLDHWSFFTMEHIVYFQRDTMEYCETDAVSSEQARYFTYASSTQGLRYQVNETYYTLTTKQQVGITLVKLMLGTIFFISNCVVTDFQFSLENFGRNGLTAVA